MANVVVFGAAGRAGARIMAEAARRGHQVTAVAREPARIGGLPAGVRAVTGDATSQASIAERAKGADAIVISVGGPDKSAYAKAARAAVAALAPLGDGGPRVIHMGGGGSLLNADGVPFFTNPKIPANLLAEMKGQAAALDVYRGSTGVRWTYVSPPPGNFAPGERKAHYRTGQEHPVVAADGSMAISYEDFAMAIVDEIERPRFIGKRFTVGY
jgi:uncharacterized protein